MFTSSNVNRTLALRPDGPTHDANLEGEKETEKAVPRCVILVFFFFPRRRAATPRSLSTSPSPPPPPFRRRTVDYFGPFMAAQRGRTLWADPLNPPTLDATAAGALQVRREGEGERRKKKPQLFPRRPPANAPAAAHPPPPPSPSPHPQPPSHSKILPPAAYAANPAAAQATKFVHMSLNKARAAVHAVAWTPEGRRALTATQGGELALWHGSTFGFETILQAHEAPARALAFSHNGNWLLSTDDGGGVKYWRPNLELVKALPTAHREPVRGVAFAPSDLKFVTACDDSTVKVWDFARCAADRTLAGHGGDAKAADWHPRLGLIASGSKDTLVKLWDARAGGGAIADLHGHTAALTSVAWNPHNGHWLASAARDATVRVVDVRTLRSVAVLTGHGRDVTSLAWHPYAETALASGGYDGSILHWLVDRPAAPAAAVRGAHEAAVWCLAWHPAGHVLASAGGDACAKFWARPRPGDPWRDTAQADQEAAAGGRGVGGEVGVAGAGDRKSVV